MGKGKCKCWRGYIAMVEGEDQGVSFRTFYHHLDAAQQAAFKTKGVVLNLKTGKRSRWIGDLETGSWHDA